MENWRTKSNLEEEMLSILDCKQHRRILDEQFNTYHQQLSKQDLFAMIGQILTNDGTENRKDTKTMSTNKR